MLQAEALLNTCLHYYGTFDIVNNQVKYFNRLLVIGTINFLKLNYDKALEYYKRVYARLERLVGKRHPSTLQAMSGIALMLRHQGKCPEALEWYEQVLICQENSIELGKDHPDTLCMVYNMARVYEPQGKRDKAQGWYENVLAGSEKTVGKYHDLTMLPVIALAGIYTRQGQFDKGLGWYERALAGYKEAKGDGHPDTLTVTESMAFNYY